MNNATVIAERAASLSLRLLGAFNLAFPLLFIAFLLLGVAQARAVEAAACGGDNLLAAMERDVPATLAEIRAAAAGIENGGALLWRVETDGAAPSYLFGTMHMSDPRVLALPRPVEAAFEASDTLVIETTDVLDPSKMMAAMLSDPALMMFTDDTTLFSLLSRDDRAALEDGLGRLGIPPSSVAKMKPWMLASMVAMPACERARKVAGEPVLDVVLAERAQEAGKPVEGLETGAEQLAAIASLPMDFHLRGLVDLMRLGDGVDDVMETMTVIYLDGDTGAFGPFFEKALPAEDGSDGGFPVFEETMITARNHTMAERAAPFLDAGGAFVAVGALHLPGGEGLVALLRDAGYRVEAVR